MSNSGWYPMDKSTPGDGDDVTPETDTVEVTFFTAEELEVIRSSVAGTLLSNKELMERGNIKRTRDIAEARVLACRSVLVKITIFEEATKS